MRRQRRERDSRVRFSVAGLSLEFPASCPAPIDAGLHEKFLSRRAAGEGNIPVQLRIARVPSRPFGTREKFYGGPLWSYFRKNGSRCYLVKDYDIRPSGAPSQAAFLDAEGITMTQRPEVGFPLFYPLDQLLYIDLLARRDGALLHAGGVNDAGRGYLFSGQSGAGKTTTTRLWQDAGAAVLNDDRTALRLRGGIPWIFGTPWPGDLQVADPGGAQLRAVLFLRQAGEFALRPVAPGQAAARLLRTSFAPLWDKEAVEALLKTLETALGKVPAFEFSFRPELKCVDYIREKLP